MMKLWGVIYYPGTTLTIPIINKNPHPSRRLETTEMHQKKFKLIFENFEKWPNGHISTKNYAMIVVEVFLEAYY